MNLHLPAKLIFAANRSKLLLIHHSPKLLMTGGLICLGGCLVTACRATLKAQDIVAEGVRNREMCDEAVRQAASDPTLTYTEADYKADRFEVARRVVVGLGKLYLPSVVLGVAGVGMIVGGNTILTQRYVATIAALSATEKAFSEYKEKMRRALGKDGEQKALMGEDTHKLTAEETESAEAIGKYLAEHPDERLNDRIPPWCGPYARVWNRESAPRAYQGNYQMDSYWLQSKQAILNQKLRMRGHLLLNEVWDELCMERNSPGAVVGWIFRGIGENIEGDDVINLNIEHYWNYGDGTDESQYQEEFIIDPNCDGMIFDKLDNPEVRKWAGPIR